MKTDIRQKTENEALVSEFSGWLKKKFCKKPKTEKDKKQWEQELEQEFLSFLEKEKILSLSEQIAPELLTAWKRETKRFMERAKSFDETLNQEQLWQALRNYFIYVMIVEMQGEEPNAKNPILAYSLLYPYTDNYIDDKQVSGQEKERYNRMIASKLIEEAVVPENPLEKKTCQLLDMILKEYLFAASDWLDEEETFYLKFGFCIEKLRGNYNSGSCHEPAVLFDELHKSIGTLSAFFVRVS